MEETARSVWAYCERIGPGPWDEPLNAVTNLAFLLAAWAMWRRCEGLAGGRLLAAALAVIGLASGAWHITAQPWAGAADSLSILGFVLIYLYLAGRDFWGLGRGGALALAAGFVPAAALAGWAAARLVPIGSSAGYLPVLAAIWLSAALLARRAPATGRGLAAGGALLALSLTMRTLDGPLCEALPMGTHFLWHVLNAVLLAFMIGVWRAHVLAARPARR